MVLAREVEREMARSNSPTPGQTPKKVKKLQSVGDHKPYIAPGNFTRLSRSPYSHCQGAVQELFSSLMEENSSVKFSSLYVKEAQIDQQQHLEMLNARNHLPIKMCFFASCTLDYTNTMVLTYRLCSPFSCF